MSTPTSESPLRAPASTNAGASWRLLVRSSGESLSIGGVPRTIGSAPGSDLRLAEAAPAHIDIGADRVAQVRAACRIGGVPIAAGEQRLLGAACRIEIGATTIEVEEAEVDLAASIPTRQMALGLLAIARRPSVPTVIVVQGPEVGQTIALDKPETFDVGRGDGCALRLEGDSRVSRRHLEIVVREAEVLVRDLDATQGTFLGERRLQPGRLARWPEGTMLRVGERTVLALRMPPREDLEAIAARIAAEPVPKPPVVTLEPGEAPTDATDHGAPAAESAPAPAARNTSAATALVEVGPELPPPLSPRPRTVHLALRWAAPVLALLAGGVALLLLYWVLA